MKKKILFLITKSNWGGAQRYVFDLATTLPRETFEVTVALGGTGLPGAAVGALAKELEKRAVRVVFVHALSRDVSISGDLRALLEVRRMLHKERPDVLHLNSSKAGGLGAFAARLSGVGSIIFTIHGLPYDEDRNPFARAAIFFATWITLLLSTSVICVSRDNFERVKKIPGCKHKTSLIHNGLPPLPFDERALARKRLVEETHLASEYEPLWIGAVGELTRNKGFSYLITAAGALARAGKRFHLFILGDGEERGELEQQIKEHSLSSCIHLVGFVPDAWKLMRAFDVFVLSSVKEGLPYVLLEAGQAKNSVIASHISGVTDIIEDGVTGLLVKPKNSEDIEDKLKTLIENASLRERLSEKLYTWVLRQFSVERMTQATAEIYRS
ncbi:MAG: glycosyltransferase family 4 protein [Patescibacteria group bacterium]|nr:glycosyltransferase family 4 protein [Patescibacteria group bacterium]